MPRHVLIVDDDAAMRRIVSLHLSRGGFETRLAGNGTEALIAVEADPPDVIVCDYQMPQMDGWVLCRRLAAKPQTRDIPIVMLTARSFELDAAELATPGNVVGLVCKPFSPSELLDLVKVAAERAVP